MCCCNDMTSTPQDVACDIEYIEVSAAVYVSDDLAKTYASWRARRLLHSAWQSTARRRKRAKLDSHDQRKEAQRLCR